MQKNFIIHSKRTKFDFVPLEFHTKKDKQTIQRNKDKSIEIQENGVNCRELLLVACSQTQTHRATAFVWRLRIKNIRG